MKPKKSKKEKTPIGMKFYIIGTLTLIVLFIVGVFYTNRPNDLNKLIMDTIYAKTEISTAVGGIVGVDDLPSSLGVSQTKIQDHMIRIRGKKKKATLTLKSFYQDGSWFLKNLQLKIDGGLVQNLSPAYVSQTQFHAASQSSASLSQATFIEGEDMFFRFILTGVPPSSQGIHIVQGIAITDSQGNEVISVKDVARFDSKTLPQNTQGIGFSNKVGSLAPGSYSAEATFIDNTTQEKISHRFPITVKESGNKLYVKSVSYFTDAAHTQKLKQPEFLVGQNIYVQLSLSGFKNEDGKIAGTVELKIASSEGAIIAHKPKFAAFNQNYEADKNVVIDGMLSLNDADVYLLAFRVHDYFSKKFVDQEEKILVKIQ